MTPTFADRTIRAFLDDVASTAVTPSGGAVAAVGGAAGAALCEMVCVHTVETGDDHGRLAELGDDLEARRARLLTLADEDAAAVERVQQAFETPAAEGREAAIRRATRRATEIPLATAEECLAVVERAETVTGRGNRNAVADGGTGALLAHAGLRASVETARVNLAAIDDDEFAAEAERDATAALDAGDAAIERVLANVREDR